MRDELCETCEHFEVTRLAEETPGLPRDHGRCRCYPPTTTYVTNVGALVWKWPMVTGKDWCGKYCQVEL